MKVDVSANLWPHLLRTIPRGLWSWVQGWLYPVCLEIPAFLLGAVSRGLAVAPGDPPPQPGWLNGVPLNPSRNRRLGRPRGNRGVESSGSTGGWAVKSQGSRRAPTALPASVLSWKEEVRCEDSSSPLHVLRAPPRRWSLPALTSCLPPATPHPQLPWCPALGSHGVLGLGLLGSDQGQRLLVKPCQESQVLTGQSCEDRPGRRLRVGVDEGTVLLPES